MYSTVKAFRMNSIFGATIGNTIGPHGDRCYQNILTQSFKIKEAGKIPASFYIEK